MFFMVSAFFVKQYKSMNNEFIFLKKYVKELK